MVHGCRKHIPDKYYSDKTKLISLYVWFDGSKIPKHSAQQETFIIIFAIFVAFCMVVYALS